eukprot:CAMPEP_0115839412 /NCGR_PEP_ID=MMETSP0287-20121206/6239_1 /TAXON_ID=412157 /ORGANISM="Chrysochromulina rotalis, Strain UIO044" /LENGTH=67 /DNA_ID=CAMNT_0003292985 /DNA_START=369 /DNA_END=573 /DNA_ORIENTATION=-
MGAARNGSSSLSLSSLVLSITWLSHFIDANGASCMGGNVGSPSCPSTPPSVMERDVMTDEEQLLEVL